MIVGALVLKTKSLALLELLTYDLIFAKTNDFNEIHQQPPTAVQ